MGDPLTPETLHDLDWTGEKARDSFYARAGRYPFLAAFIGDLRPRRLLDVGCGSGYLARLVTERTAGVEVHGVDVSAAALERARRHLAAVWKVDLDRDPIPVENGAYDTVVCVEVLEHLYDPTHVLSEIRRALAPGGQAVLTVPNLAFWRFRFDLLRGRVPAVAADRRHLHQFDAALFERMLREAGFSVRRLVGYRERFKSLACWRPSLFSDILIALAAVGGDRCDETR
jgi:2-polyprenyl-3-methyl-5-hydroxy-6-metoxy-1,4-benzoquinol methylase